MSKTSLKAITSFQQKFCKSQYIFPFHAFEGVFKQNYRFLLLTFCQLSQVLSESRTIYTSLMKLDNKFPVNEQRVYHLCKKLLVIGSRKKKLATRKAVVWLRIHFTSWVNYVKINTLRLMEYVSIHNQE